MPPSSTTVRYRQVRVAEKLNDQLSPAQIATGGAPGGSQNQEDYQQNLISQLKRIIFGDAAGDWYDDFIAENILSLRDLSTTTVTGAVAAVRFPLGTAPAQTSVTSIPAGAIVQNILLEIITAYSPGTLIQVGNATDPSLLMDTPDNAPTFENQYEAVQATSWGPLALPVLVTVTGAPTVGVGECVVTYTLPNP